ncbi:MAG: ABC transporter substrate-binding protein [Xanthobacteraceae bacterium]
MHRREFVLSLASTAVLGSARAFAQTGAPPLHVALMNPGGLLPLDHMYAKLLLPALEKRGYVLGQKLALELPGTGSGAHPKLAELLDQLKSKKIDAVVTLGYPTAVAAKTSGIATVVAGGAGDPVATGLVDSLAHPGGNVTGISDDATTLSTKRLELLKEMSPQLRRVAMLWNKDDLAMSLRYDASARAAQDMGITVQPLGVREPDDFNDAFAAMNKDLPDAILMVSDSLTLLNRKRVFDFAAERRLPAIYEADYIARDGGLMSYGADQAESFDRVAALVDRIFKGAKPADLPFELPTRYKFVINLKTAKAMNFTIPNTLLALADDVIE